MAKDKSRAADDVAPTSPPVNEIWIVGLIKTGNDRYAVVTGTTTKPIVHVGSDPIHYALEACKAALHKLGQTIP